MQTVAYHSTNCLGTHTAKYSGSKPPLGTLKDPHGGLDPEYSTVSFSDKKTYYRRRKTEDRKFILWPRFSPAVTIKSNHT